MSVRPRGHGSGTARPLLFERLADAGPAAGRDRDVGAVGARAAVEASVAREIFALLNTRISIDVDAIEPPDRTVTEYGLPDFTGLTAKGDSDRERIAGTIERAIRAFEPRLAEPRVIVLEGPAAYDSLGLVISGTLTVDAIASPFEFDLALAAETDLDGE